MPAWSPSAACSLSSVSDNASGASREGTFAFHIEGDIDPPTESGSFEFFC